MKGSKKNTYALQPVAVRKTSNMWKFSRRSCERMTDGEATPAAERAAPKRAPEVAVARFAIAAVLFDALKIETVLEPNCRSLDKDIS